MRSGRDVLTLQIVKGDGYMKVIGYPSPVRRNMYQRFFEDYGLGRGWKTSGEDNELHQFRPQHRHIKSSPLTYALDLLLLARLLRLLQCNRVICCNFEIQRRRDLLMFLTTMDTLTLQRHGRFRFFTPPVTNPPPPSSGPKSDTDKRVCCG